MDKYQNKEYACANKSNYSEDEEILKQLSKQQSVTIGIIISVIATFGILEVLLQSKGQIPMYVFLVPGVVVGALVKVLARPYTLSARLVPSLIVAAIVFLYFSFQTLTLYSIFLPFLNVLVCLGLSRRSMTHGQESALYRKRLNG